MTDDELVPYAAAIKEYEELLEVLDESLPQEAAIAKQIRARAAELRERIEARRRTLGADD